MNKPYVLKCSSRVLHPRAPCGGIIPPTPPQAIALLPPAPVLSRNSAENFCLRGYYTPTPPLRGCYTLALPHLFVCSSFEHMFCQGIAPKNFYLQRRQKFFAPLTTTKTTIINTRAERFPAPRLSCYMTRRTLGGAPLVKELDAHTYTSSPEGNIRMKNKEKPSRTRGAY